MISFAGQSAQRCRFHSGEWPKGDQELSLRHFVNTSRARTLVRVAAGSSRASRTACPDHRFVKSLEPAPSALARSDARAALASGKLGTADEIGPSSRISRLTIPRAGRPVKTLVIMVASSAAVL